MVLAGQRVEAVAPVSGKILQLWPHAYVIMTADKVGVLVHLAGDRVPVGGTRERLVVAAAYVAVGVWLAWPVWGAVSGTLATV